MRKVVLTFGLISGAILSAMMSISMIFRDEIGMGHSLWLGYTTMLLAFLLVFFGVRSYRDNVAGGKVSFGRAFKVGALIALVSSACYVATWEVLYFNFMPDFVEKYQEQALSNARADGQTEEQIAAKKAEFEKMFKYYDNPFFNSAITFLEPLPVALLVSLISAGVLSRKQKGEVPSTA